jgi:hypothetical protein
MDIEWTLNGLAHWLWGQCGVVPFVTGGWGLRPGQESYITAEQRLSCGFLEEGGTWHSRVCVYVLGE